MTETKLKLEDWLDDLCVRFIINLPQEELESVERIGFAVEEAQWFYEDFVRPLDPALPSLSLRSFCLRIFQHCPLLSEFSQYHHLTAFSEFLAYKTRVPVRGAILLNDEMDKVVLVKGWKKGASWSFPRGKINKDEKDLNCAVREVYEETGFDAEHAGLTKDETEMKFIEVTMRDQNIRLYVFRGVSMDTHFEPRTRKEISKIQWHSLSELPTFKKMRQQQQGHDTDELATNANRFYMVAPFLVPLKKWIARQKQLDVYKIDETQNLAPVLQSEDLLTEEEPALAEAYGHGTPSNLRSKPSDLPEVSGVDDSDQDASILLKRLLSVQGPVKADQVASSQDQQSTPSNQEKSDALLTLLHKSRHATLQKSLPSVEPPQTPSEQLMGGLVQPGPPRHQYHDPPRLSGLPTPPSFPIPPSHPGQPAQNNFRHSPQPISNNTDRQQNFHRFPHQPQNHSQHSLPQRVAPRELRQPDFSNSVPHGPTLPLFLQQSHQQGLTDLQADEPKSTQTPQFRGTHVPIIPPATSLPAPKLTDHALKLLNAFKSTTMSNSADNSNGSFRTPELNASSGAIRPPDHRHDKSNIKHPVGHCDNQGSNVTRPSNVLESPKASPPANGSLLPPTKAPNGELASKTSPPSAPPRSQHQIGLLDLFRKASGQNSPAATVTNARPQKPSSPVELSAQISPGIPKQNCSPPGDSVTSPKLESKSTTRRQPVGKHLGHVSVPTSNGIPKKKTTGPGVPVTPVSILSRAGASPSRKQDPVMSVSMPPKAEAAPSRMKDSDRNHKKHDRPAQVTQKSRKCDSTTFQPKILRRPNQSEGKISDAIPHQATDPREGQAAEHKQALLSLFSKPSPSNSPQLGRITSPGEGLPEALSLDTRSRQASIADTLISAGSGKGANQPLSSGSQTPITPVDKGFLLGFLEGHTRSERR
ncbi:MAG: mRNA-decapping enzyme subunit 2 [Sclerophora amabilis]|nr:MAG: mRNA-decapping enzyme subunit 2 [Sclerophora amabilis]